MKDNLDKQESGLIDKEYKCEKCRDLTFIINDGIAVPCECRALKQAEDILKKSGISEEFRNKTFDNFNYAHDIQTIEAFTKASFYVKAFYEIEDSRNNSIIFMGQVGYGKTYLSMAISNILMDGGVGVIYMPFRDVIINIKYKIYYLFRNMSI